MIQDYLIIEDESFATEELKRMISKLRPEWQLIGVADSVVAALHYLDEMQPTLIVADIRLSDGLCFDIFRQHPTDIPVIFTTAYDEYAIEAFRSNSVDYLLKPIEEKFLERAILKLERNKYITVSKEIVRMADDYQKHIIKTRILIQIGDEYRHIDVEDIAYFYSEDKYTYLCTKTSKRYIIPYTLDSLQNMLDNHKFFRISRNCISSIAGISRCNKHFAGRLSIHLLPEVPFEIIVSRKRSADVLRWMDDNY
jgi:DNA-binding LytR/AlgR family response regulator